MMPRIKGKNNNSTKKITRKDIADYVGVSVSVVSRAVNNSGYVEKEKKRKIISAAKKFGYVSSKVAMSLAEQRTRIILFFCKDMDNRYNIEMFLGIRDMAATHGYMAVLNGLIGFDNVKNTLIDGIILPSELIAEYYLKRCGMNYNIPAVVCTYGSDYKLSKSIPAVDFDMYKAIEMGVRYLRKNGHKKIAYAMPYYFN